MKLIKISINTILLFFLLLLASCVNLSEEEIIRNLKSGSVLVVNTGYYEVKLESGQSIYFNTFDNEGYIDDISFESPDSLDVKEQLGVGFYVSDDGKILTNAHIVYNVKSLDEINDSISSFFDSYSSLVRYLRDYSSSEKEELEEEYWNIMFDDDYSYLDTQLLKERIDSISSVISTCDSELSEINGINFHNSTIVYHPKICVLSDGDEISEMSSVEILTTSVEHDLSLLQHIDKQTPAGAYVFEIPEDDPIDHYSFGDKISNWLSSNKNSSVYTSYFKISGDLTMTSASYLEVQAGIHDGFIDTTYPDSSIYCYSFSGEILPEYTGSPIVNKRCELIGINTVIYDNDSTVREYGIRHKHIKSIL